MLGNIVTNPALLENADRIYYRDVIVGYVKLYKMTTKM